METPRILLTGATGYIGGTVLNTILTSSHPCFKNVHISVLVRRQDQADILSGLGVTPILFNSLDDTDLLTEAASTHNVVIHAANGYHIPSAKALLVGLAQRKANTGKPVHYIHNSGTSNFGNRPVSGKYLEEPREYSDKDDIYAYEKFREEKEQYDQRTSDVVVFETGADIGVETYIICSPLIYGRGTGLFNKSSIQIPVMIRAALARGQAIYAGDGLGVWDHTHIEDIANLYTLIANKILDGEKIPSGKEGFYFANHGKQSWLDIANGIARVGYQRGKLVAEPKSVSLAEASLAWFGGDEDLTEPAICSHSQTRGDKSRELGWQPLKDDSRWEQTIVEEFEVALKAMA
ncbi:nad dependent epimerase dehydratase family protein [Fusarium flagelliforme]|uniref:Nad dependent epimerase dehydratase family protein n=1 Tax=Fusarium flagelliforme TaxID=2675880 RepID=A0A395MPC2_9HYPO|nr:nad dependent epimerase dehydratase family protein [Fusarium flagelliforme]